jgi:integrase
LVTKLGVAQKVQGDTADEFKSAQNRCPIRITIKEKKTGKTNVICLSRFVHKILRQYLDERKPDGSEYLFISKKGTNRPLNVSTVSSMIKSWCKSLHIVGNYGSHSLRKSWGFHQRTKYGVGMELLMKRFNHSSMSVTLRYVGLQDKDVNDLLLNEI